MAKVNGILLGVVSFLLLSFPSYGEGEWWDKNWNYRIKLTFKAKDNLYGKNIPVIITGEQLFKKTGVKELNLHSIRITDENNAEIPLQIDEKDGTGEYQKEPNGKWDNDDDGSFLCRYRQREGDCLLDVFPEGFFSLTGISCRSEV